MAVTTTQRKYVNQYAGYKAPSAQTQAATPTQNATAQNGYNPATTQAQQQQAAQQQAVQGAVSNPSAALGAIYSQIGDGGKQFNYNFNEDELFKYYADLYTQKGKQASLDTMGQAAALTGGYGNSYAQNAANQQYQQYLLGLYDKGMEFNNMAYQRFADDAARQLQYDQMNEQAYQYDRNMAYQYAMIMLQSGKMPSDELLATAGISKADAQAFITPIDVGGGGGGGGSSGGGGGSPKPKTTSTTSSSSNKNLNGLTYKEATLIDRAPQIEAAAKAAGVNTKPADAKPASTPAQVVNNLVSNFNTQNAASAALKKKLGL